MTASELETPPLWHSYYHVIYTVVFCALGIVIPSCFLDGVQAVEFLAIPATFMFANFFEYFIHRWPMHQHYKNPGAEMMLKLHMIHHNYFSEKTHPIRKFDDFAMVVFPPFVLNAIAFVIAPPVAAVCWWLFGTNVALLFYSSVIAYYLLMQIIHVFCHFDENHWVSRLPMIRYLWVHHQIHHTKEVMKDVNFNFIVPFADFFFRTATQTIKREDKEIKDEPELVHGKG